jgi:hypothetical protein
MFRALTGYKARYHYLTLLVAADFNEWKVMLLGPGVTIQGTRQFTEEKAKEHARAVAQSFLAEEKHEDLPAPPQLDWTPLDAGEWMNWRT